MAKKKNKAKVSRPPSNAELEDRPAVAVTVAWMLASVSSAAAGVVWVISRLLVALVTVPGGNPPPFALIPGAMWMIALITGTLGLGLMIVALRVREVPPPRSAILFSLAAGVVPYVAFVVGLFWR